MSNQLNVVSIEDGYFAVIAAHLAKNSGLDVAITTGATATSAVIGGVTTEGVVEAANAFFEAAVAKDASLASLIDASTAAHITTSFEQLYNKKDFTPAVVKEFDTLLADKSSFNGTSFTVGDLAAYAFVQTNKRWPIMLKQKVDAQSPNFFKLYSSLIDVNSTNVVVKAVCAAHAMLTAEEQAAKAAKLKASKSGSFEVDLPGAIEGKVVTRFPPEPSGYLHIGHAKALLLNNYFAERFKGKMLLRFDDTNPSKEKGEYVENIMKDLETLQVKWTGPTHSSDYFDLMLDYAKQMIKDGNAYIDDTPVEQMRAERLAKVESKHRSNSVEQNLAMFDEMIAGTEKGLQCVMRGKIDMSSANGCMRDPTFFRCNLTPHHRTGSKYKVYPTYDFCCPIIDSIEGVTHTLRTIEYHDRNHQYNWVCDVLKIRKPHIWDFSRLNFVYTLLSKRNLQWFVDNKLVEGWFDPRFPTVQGIIRRGLSVKCLKDFMISQGASKNINLMEWDKLWALNKSALEPTAARYNAVITADKVPLKFSDITETTVVQQQKHMKNAAVGVKDVVVSPVMFIEQEDAKAIADNEEITLMMYGNVIVESIERDGDKVVAINVRSHLAGDVKKTSKKITWVGFRDESELIPLTLVEYGPLITAKKVEDNVKVQDIVNMDSKHVTYALGEAAMRDVKVNDVFQIQRKGFYRVDAVNGDEKVLIYIPDGSAKAQPGLGK